MRYSFPHNSWYGRKPVDICLPDDWDVTECRMPADDLPPLTVRELRRVLDDPVGTRPIRELAVGKKEVCILFDDMSRGTPCDEIAHLILEDLAQAGIPKRNIRFICALGSHGTCTREDFARKLGEDIVREYAVFNHNPFQNCELVGRTSGGVELYINSEIMRCDLKIGIGSISPHPVNGYGGGGKLLAIGCAGMQTIDQLHKASMRCIMEKGLPFARCVGNWELDGMRKEIEEAVRITGFDFKIDAILNSDCRIVACTAGDPVAEHAKGAALSEKLNFSTVTPQGMDVVIANANVKANEASIAFIIAKQLLKPNTGTVVLIDEIPTGQVVHHYAGAQGYYTGGMAFSGIKDRLPDVEQAIFCSPYPDKQSAISFGDDRRITFAENWEAVMALLGSRKAGTKAALITDATIIGFR